MSGKKGPERTEPEAGNRTPREKVLGHLERLLREAAVAGAGAAVLACNLEAPRPPQVDDPLPPPVNCKVPDQFIVESCVLQRARWAPPRQGQPAAIDLALWWTEKGERDRYYMPLSTGDPYAPPRRGRSDRASCPGPCRSPALMPKRSASRAGRWTAWPARPTGWT